MEVQLKVSETVDLQHLCMEMVIVHPRLRHYKGDELSCGDRRAELGRIDAVGDVRGRGRENIATLERPRYRRKQEAIVRDVERATYATARFRRRHQKAVVGTDEELAPRTLNDDRASVGTN